MSRTLWLFGLLIACTGDKVADTADTANTSDTSVTSEPTSEVPSEPTSEAPSEPDSSPTSEPGSEECGEETTGRRLIRRLTRIEFENTVRSVFGLDEQTWSATDLPPDSAAENGFSNNADRLSVSSAFASVA